MMAMMPMSFGPNRKRWLVPERYWLMSICICGCICGTALRYLYLLSVKINVQSFFFCFFFFSFDFIVWTLIVNWSVFTIRAIRASLYLYLGERSFRFQPHWDTLKQIIACGGIPCVYVSASAPVSPYLPRNTVFFSGQASAWISRLSALFLLPLSIIASQPELYFSRPVASLFSQRQHRHLHHHHFVASSWW